MLHNKTTKNATHQCYDSGTSSSTSHNEQVVRHVELKKKQVKNIEAIEDSIKCISTVLENKDSKTNFVARYSKLQNIKMFWSNFQFLGDLTQFQCWV